MSCTKYTLHQIDRWIARNVSFLRKQASMRSLFAYGLLPPFGEGLYDNWQESPDMSTSSVGFRYDLSWRDVGWLGITLHQSNPTFVNVDKKPIFYCIIILVSWLSNTFMLSYLNHPPYYQQWQLVCDNLAGAWRLKIWNDSIHIDRKDRQIDMLASHGSKHKWRASLTGSCISFLVDDLWLTNT